MKAVITLRKTNGELVVWIFSVTLEQIASMYSFSKAKPLRKNVSIQAVEITSPSKALELVIPEDRDDITLFDERLDKNVNFVSLLRYLEGIHFDHS